MPNRSRAPAPPQLRVVDTQRATPLMRKVEIVSLRPDGTPAEIVRLVPAISAFDRAFAAFTRATLLQTERGLVAVGDLWPGDRVRTLHNGFQTLMWKGQTAMVPQGRGQETAMTRLTRLAADALGIARPMPDLVLGPHARIVHRAARVARLTGKEGALIPARDFLDGVSVLDITPPATVDLFHLGFAAHEILIANGVEVDSYHPGALHNLWLRPEWKDLFLSCFPHIRTGDDFGPPVMQMLRMSDLDMVPAREA
jgi:hypothetical protein